MSNQTILVIAAIVMFCQAILGVVQAVKPKKSNWEKTVYFSLGVGFVYIGFRLLLI